MLDHVGFGVSGYERGKAFYEQALAPLGITRLMEPVAQAAGFGRDGKPLFWIETRGPAVTGGLHVAYVVEDRALVHAFHEAALAAGGTDNGAPGPREIHHPHYYGGYVLDPDGNDIEAVCHTPA